MPIGLQFKRPLVTMFREFPTIDLLGIDQGKLG